jgi:hypothetical protein
MILYILVIYMLTFNELIRESILKRKETIYLILFFALYYCLFVKNDL